jgi:hypothetical protein
MIEKNETRDAGLEEAARRLENVAATLETDGISRGPEEFSRNITAVRYKRAAVIIRALKSTPAPANGEPEA